MASIYDASLKGLCNGILAFGEDQILNNNPLFMTSSNGTLESVMSEINRRSVKTTQLSEANGKLLGKYRVAWSNRAIVDDVTTTLDCDAPTAKKPVYEETYDVANQIQSDGFTLEAADWQLICKNEKDVNGILGAYITTDMNAAREKLNRELADHINANCIGINLANEVSGSPSASAKTLNILNSDSSARSQGLAQLAVDKSTNYLTGPLLIAGQGNMELYLQLLQIGCCNDVGIDQSKVMEYMSRQGYGFYKDHYGNTAYGTDTCLVFAPGAIQMLTFNRYTGMYQYDIAGTKAFTMPDPITPGLTWDVLVKEVPCADGTGMPSYQFKLQLNWDAVCIPDEAYAASDELRGMKNTFLYTFGQAS